MARGVQPIHALRSHQHRAAQALLGDQLLVEPFAQAALAGAGLLRSSRDALGVVTGQRFIHLPESSQVLFPDAEGVRAGRVPQAVADHLELHRLDMRAELCFHLPVRALHPHPAQVIQQFLHGGVFEFDPRLAGRALDGLAGRLNA
jgi:hypothetical protein